MEFGIGKLAIVYEGSVYTPTNQTALIPDVDNQNNARRSIKTSKVNLRAKWTYYNATVRIKELTDSEITYFRNISGKEVRLYPHIDEAFINYYCSVTKAEIKYENGKTWKPYVDLRFDGIYNTEILTPQHLTLTAPIAGQLAIKNSTLSITWETGADITGTIDIELWKAGVKLSTIASDQDNDGSYDWTVSVTEDGTDYQIKIIANDYDGLLYDISDEFELKILRYYLPNSLDANDWVKIEKTTLGDEFSIAFRYKDWALSASNYRFISNSGGTTFLINTDYGTVHKTRIQSGYTNASFSSSVSIKVSSSTWHDIVITVKVSTQSCTMYFDGVADTGIIPPSGGYAFEATSFNYLKLFYGATGGIKAKIKDVLITSDIMSATEAGYFHAGTVSLINNKLLWYKCDETAAFMGSAPYTNKTLDSSGNNNHGTPTNITPAAFCGEE